jgi:DNA-directed RNA polymerase specialized sigma24 family protein
MVEEMLNLERFFVARERNLTEEQSNFHVLRFQEDFSLKEMAEIVGINLNAAVVLRNRGINKLRQAMGRLDGEYQ